MGDIDHRALHFDQPAHGAHFCVQHHLADRFQQVVIAADLDAARQVGIFGHAGEEDDRGPVILLFGGANLLGDIESVDIGQLRIQQDEIGVFLAINLDGRCAGLGSQRMLDVHAFQEIAQYFQCDFAVFHHQHFESICSFFHFRQFRDFRAL